MQHIHGPVSRLIHTEDRFTTAIEIALGAAMQQIVVGDESDAKAAIAFLKRTGGGRATFLPLGAIAPRTLQEPGVERCRGFVGIASRLVRCIRMTQAAGEKSYSKRQKTLTCARGLVPGLLWGTVLRVLCGEFGPGLRQNLFLCLAMGSTSRQ